jgi:hypothetical protein
MKTDVEDKNTKECTGVFLINSLKILFLRNSVYQVEYQNLITYTKADVRTEIVR